MSARTKNTMAAEFDGADRNDSGNPTLMDVLEARLSRRNMLRLGVGSAGVAVLGSVAACGGGDASEPIRLGFEPVARSLADAVLVPAGYRASVLYALGDPLTADTPEFRNDGTDTDFARRAGDHHDGLEYFGLNAEGTAASVSGSQRGILAMNHEAITDQFLHPNGASPRPRPPAQADKEMDAHGLSFVEVRRTDGSFAYQRNSRWNRRVTPLTPIELTGPARGSVLLRTRYSTAGTQTRGTINNCGASSTPWGTFFSGEENWNGYFYRGADDAARGGATARSVVALARYGKPQNSASRHGWETAGSDDRYQRWNVTQTGASADGSDDYRNEINTFGYMVEADPYAPDRAPRKRTALGRFAHEMGVFGRAIAGQPLVVYLGDDSRGEYIYKYVSTAAWTPADADPADRLATGDKYLDAGRLYVARFNADGTGTWIELDIANPAIAGYGRYPFADQADVLVHARLAADAVGATRMDRPEWTAVHPVHGEVYVTLTNNSNRRVEPASGSQHAVDPANPRSYGDAPSAPGSPGNINGHVLRLREAGDANGATTFTWDIYLFGAEAGMDPQRVNLSSLTDDNDFSSPDGIWFSKKTGLLFLQTDDGAYTDVTNCMMLVGRPGRVGDGGTRLIEYTRADGSRLAVQTRVGAPVTADSLRRFLVGPTDCEITGIAETPDGRTLFVNIQHPGESIARADVSDPSRYLSHWPGNAGYGAGGASARPRSATIVITRDDGGLIAAEGDEVLNGF